MKENNNKEKTGKNKMRADLEQLVFNMVKELPKRSRDIVIKRFNLNKSEEASTLEKIGEEYKITRERVRQIESEAISKLKNIGEKHNIGQVFESVKNSVENHGGIAGEEKIISYLFGEENGGKTSRQIILFILALDGKIKKAGETKMHRKIYFYKKESVEKFKSVIKRIEEHLEKNKKDANFDEMLEIANEYLKGEEKFSSLHLKSYLDENKIILKNILGRWGHTKWPHINPKNIRDKAYLALKKSEEPLHFVEIANKINKFWRGGRIANSQTTHNELIKDDRFVLVGRGIYALKEWGYSPGTVLNVIIEILKESGGKMEQGNIIQEVLKRRQVKKNTIVLNLQNKKYFEKAPNRIYRLR